MRPTTAWESWVGGVLDLDHLGLGHLRRLVHLLHGVGGPLDEDSKRCLYRSMVVL